MSAALLEGSGRVWAFDMDPRRLARLEANAAAAGAGNVVATQADFLQVDVQDEQYSQARGLYQTAGVRLCPFSAPSALFFFCFWFLLACSFLYAYRALRTRASMLMSTACGLMARCQLVEPAARRLDQRPYTLSVLKTSSQSDMSLGLPAVDPTLDPPSWRSGFLNTRCRYAACSWTHHAAGPAPRPAAWMRCCRRAGAAQTLRSLTR